MKRVKNICLLIMLSARLFAEPTAIYFEEATPLSDSVIKYQAAIVNVTDPTVILSTSTNVQTES